MAASHDENGLIDSDLPSAVRLLNHLTEQVVAVTSHVQGLLKRVKDGDYPTAQGLSFLDLRYQLLLFYLQDVTHLISVKSQGGSVRDGDVLHRLVAVRTVMEKMRPIDQKLRYQIDKLVRTAVTGSVVQNDPLQLRPNPENLVSKISESEESEDDAEVAEHSGKRDSSGGRKYVPPRLVPMHYDGDMTEAERQKEMADKRKRAALRSSVIQELRQQYSDAPEEIRDRRDFQTERQSRDEQHRKEYEESMMVRLSVSRQDKAARKRRTLAMSSQLSAITRFSDITALTGGDGQDMGSSQPKKKKRMMKKKTKKKAFKKRH